MARLLPRLGTVVDVDGLAPDAAIAAAGVAEPDGIVAFTDSQLATGSTIAAGLGLRFNSPSVTERFLDKYEQRRALKAAGIPVPGVVAISPDASAAQIAALTVDIAFPAVLKLRRGYGSRDMYHVANAEQLRQLLAPDAGDRVAAPEEYVLEEYIPDAPQTDTAFADYVSVESVVVNAQPRHLAITGKTRMAEPYRETGNFMPSGLPRDEEAAVYELATRVVAALGVEYGCMHTEIKLTADGPRVIEANARVGGGGIENIFGMAYGQSLMQFSAMTALGIELPPAVEPPADWLAYQLFVQPPFAAHRLTKIDGIDAVSALPGVEQIAFNRQVGEAIDWRTGSQGYVCSIRGTTTDREGLRAVREQILAALRLDYS
jgi:biotin carboxylase